MKPIVFFDIEATGTDVAKDRICQIALKKYEGLGGPVIGAFESLVNPGRPMTEEVIAIHGITNEMVKDAPSFSELSHGIFEFVDGCDLGGFNHTNFDIPLLWEEFYRCGYEWSLNGALVIDAGNIFKKKEERSLSAAVQFYCNRKHEKAHTAMGDVDATVEVLGNQLARYPDLQKLPAKELADFSRFDDRIDLAGKIVRDKDGDPSYAIGKAKGKKVKDDPGFAYWMLDRDFPMNTKRVLQSILDSGRGEEDQERAEMNFDQTQEAR